MCPSNTAEQVTTSPPPFELDFKRLTPLYRVQRIEPGLLSLQLRWRKKPLRLLEVNVQKAAVPELASAGAGALFVDLGPDGDRTLHAYIAAQAVEDIRL